MSEEQIDINYHEIVAIYTKLQMLDARILKLEEILVKVCNEEPVEEEIDWAEVGQQRRDEEEGWRDR